MTTQPETLGQLRNSEWSEARIGHRSVKQELRENLLRKIEAGEPLFKGIHGYEETVTPQIVNSLLSRHHFILLGLRGQAKTRILRGLVAFLDPLMPAIAGCEINDNPYAPLCRSCRDRIAKEGDATPIEWIPRDRRYVEKLATPDVTIADIIGDVDPIKAARSGRDLSDEMTIHYGLLPRANRGIFAINELPDLAGKIQVGLFNIMQEGDIPVSYTHLFGAAAPDRRPAGAVRRAHPTGDGPPDRIRQTHPGGCKGSREDAAQAGEKG